jgi:hypothetical protein
MAKLPSYKIDLELRVVNGQTFLSFWDIIGGEDIVTEVKDNKLFRPNGKEITLQEFVDKVVEQVKRY